MVTNPNVSPFNCHEICLHGSKHSTFSFRELVPLTNFRQDYPKSHSRFVHTISDRRSEYEALVAWVLDMPEQRSAAQLETVTTLERLSLEAVGYGVHLPFRFKPRFFLCEQADS